MSKYTKTLTTDCPSCDARIHFEKRPRLGDVVVCNECEENLEVVRLTPLKLDWSLLDDDESWTDVNYDDDDKNGQYDRYD